MCYDLIKETGLYGLSFCELIKKLQILELFEKLEKNVRLLAAFQ